MPAKFTSSTNSNNVIYNGLWLSFIDLAGMIPKAKHFSGKCQPGCKKREMPYAKQAIPVLYPDGLPAYCLVEWISLTAHP